MSHPEIRYIISILQDENSFCYRLHDKVTGTFYVSPARHKDIFLCLDASFGKLKSRITDGWVVETGFLEPKPAMPSFPEPNDLNQRSRS